MNDLAENCGRFAMHIGNINCNVPGNYAGD